MLTASRKEIPWIYPYVLDPRLVTTGVYFAELRAEGARVSRKVVVLN